MQQFLTPLLGIAFSLTVFVGSVSVVSALLPEPEPNGLENIDISSLWTLHPVKVDPSKQHFERLPALNVPRRETAKATQLPVLDEVATGSVNPKENAGTPEKQLSMLESVEAYDVDIVGPESTQSDLARIEWCSERYRSYRASDNTYQPYRGPRRSCEPPVTAALSGPEPEAYSVDEADAADAAYAEDAHIQWCSARYRSYNVQDNTYRAFSGHRRPCASPYI